MYSINLEELIGIDLDYIILGLAALVLILIIVMIVQAVNTSKLKKSYKAFMNGKDAKSLEDNLIAKLNKVDELTKLNEQNEEQIEKILHEMKFSFKKSGMVKYDAFNEMGGKLSFSLALLNQEDDGFIINAMHSREGCYTYIKEIVKGNSYIVLAEEEAEALAIAKGEKKQVADEE